MSVYRKPFKSGKSVVVSIPYYLLEWLECEPGDYFLITRHGSDCLKFRVVKADERLKDKRASAGTWKAPTPLIVSEPLKGARYPGGAPDKQGHPKGDEELN